MNPGFYELDPFLQDKLTQFIKPEEYSHTLMRLLEEPYQSFIRGVKDGTYGRDDFIAVGFIYPNLEECDKDYSDLRAKIVSKYSDELGRDMSLLGKLTREKAEDTIRKIPALANLEGTKREVWINRLVNLQTQPVFHSIAYA
jgi:hypothetical protein